MVERRQELRRPGGGIRARVRPGHRLTIVDVSARGALLEGTSALRPGARVEIQLEGGSEAPGAGACVVRCVVFAIDGEKGVTYRTALSFDRRCEEIREAVTHGGYRLHAATDGNGPPIAGSGAYLPADAEGHEK